MPITIRSETRLDAAGIHDVVAAAFGRPAEADLVDRLRARERTVLSLVAVDAGAIVGHVLFTPVALSGHPEVRCVGLAPLAVTPSRQRQGIGAALVAARLDGCRRLARDSVVVIGDPAYYGRFGFARGSRFEIGNTFGVPDEAFMVLELRPGALAGKRGLARYDAAFDEPGDR